MKLGVMGCRGALAWAVALLAGPAIAGANDVTSTTVPSVAPVAEVSAAARPASAPAKKPVAATPRDTARVYQQRTADGGILLTDRPQDEARTERSWAMEREDPAAARARSDRVSAEAQAVSERIQKRIDHDQQLRDADAERRQASVDAAAETARRAADAESRYAVGVYRPLAVRPRNNRPPRSSMPTPHNDDRPVPRPGRSSKSGEVVSTTPAAAPARVSNRPLARATAVGPAATDRTDRD